MKTVDHEAVIPVEELAPKRRFGSYPEYRDSGVEWLGEAPSHWKVHKLKYVASLRTSNVDKKSHEEEQPVRLCNYTDVYYNERITSSSVFMNATATPEEIDRFSLMKGDVLITKDSEDPNDIAVPACVMDDLQGVLCGYHLAQIRSNPSLAHGPYLARAFKASGIRDQFSSQATGITRHGLSKDTIGSSLFFIPPPEEQRAIAAFLDRETGRIDELIAKKQRLLKLLAEKRTALISHAVTKGLNPDAPMKDSGIEWLGDVPQHWHKRPLKFFSNLRARSFVDGDWIETPYIKDEGIRLIQCGNIGTGAYEEQGFRFISTETFYGLGCTPVRPGDVLICRMRSSKRILAGRACLAPPLGDRMVTAVDNCIVKCAGDVAARFLVYQLSSKAYLEHVEIIARGGTRDRISRSMLGSIRLVSPPLKEQQAIAAFLDRETARIDELVAKVNEAIDKLREYRSALISAAVTGKIDVRGFQQRGAPCQ